MSARVKASLNPFTVNLSPAQSGFIASGVTVFPTPWPWCVIMQAPSFDPLYSTTPIPGIDWTSAWDREGLNPIQSTVLIEIGKGFVPRQQPWRRIGNLSWCSSSSTSFLFFVFLVLERLKSNEQKHAVNDRGVRTGTRLKTLSSIAQHCVNGVICYLLSSFS